MDPNFERMEWQNGFESTLDGRVVLTDTYIPMTPVPEGDFGRLVLEDTSKENFEIIRYNRKDAAGVFTEVADGGLRNEDGTSTGIHARGARIRGNITAQDIRELRENMQAVENSSVVGFADEAFVDFVVAGTGILAQTTLLTGSFSNIICYINGLRVVKTSIPNKVYTASKDTYVFINNLGVVTYTEVANNATAPATPANSLFVAIVITSATVITSVALRSRGPVAADNIDFTTFGNSYKNMPKKGITVTMGFGASARVNRFGNIVTVTFAGQTSTSTPNNGAAALGETMPLGYRPAEYEVRLITRMLSNNVSTGAGFWSIKTNGAMVIYTSTNQLSEQHGTVTYVTLDDFPV